MAHETQTLQPGLLRSSITRIPEGVTQHSAAQHTTAWHMAAQRSSTCLYASRRYITRPLAWSTADVPASALVCSCGQLTGVPSLLGLLRCSCFHCCAHPAVTLSLARQASQDSNACLTRR